MTITFKDTKLMIFDNIFKRITLIGLKKRCSRREFSTSLLEMDTENIPLQQLFPRSFIFYKCIINNCQITSRQFLHCNGLWKSLRTISLYIDSSLISIWAASKFTGFFSTGLESITYRKNIECGFHFQ